MRMISMKAEEDVGRQKGGGGGREERRRQRELAGSAYGSLGSEGVCQDWLAWETKWLMVRSEKYCGLVPV